MFSISQVYEKRKIDLMFGVFVFLYQIIANINLLLRVIVTSGHQIRGLVKECPGHCREFKTESQNQCKAKQCLCNIPYRIPQPQFLFQVTLACVKLTLRARQYTVIGIFVF